VVEVITRDGKIFSERIEFPKGNPNNPVMAGELVDSFRGMAAYAAKPLSGAQVDDAISLALSLEETADVSTLTKLLTH
jgi:hypothetical protein